MFSQRSSGLSVDELLACCVQRVLDNSEDCTFERLVYECFTQFPGSFSLQRYPQWPDSARVNKSWLRCRTDKGWVIGSVQEGFRLTDAGKRVAARVESVVKSGQSPNKLTTEPTRSRERYQALLRQIREHPLFKQFLNDSQGFALTEMEFRHLLGCTLETPVRVLRQNLMGYRKAAEAYDDTKVLHLLDQCELRMQTLLKRPNIG
jgi:hypothetical protein